MASPTQSLDAIERAIDYAFQDKSLLQAALVHTSYVNERPQADLQPNERLEFLGDAVLGLIAAHRLYEARPDSAEGDLTVSRAWLVRQSTLARWAADLNLGRYLLLGRGESRGGGRERPALLARGLEALFAAVYLDGGLSAARSVIEPFVDAELAKGISPQRTVDAKSRLQQVCQARFESTPQYTVVDHSGPGHAPLFTVEVHVGPDVTARGTGSSKRAAQQAAAHQALQELAVTEAYELPDQDSGVPQPQQA